MNRPFKILILKPSSLGDVVQALPVLRLIKDHLPSAQVYWWIDSRLAPLLEGDPDLAGVVPFDRQGWARTSSWFALWHDVRWIRQQSFDWVIDLQSLARSGAFAWVANGKLTIGMDEPREGARGFYDLVVRRPSFHTHAVDWYLGVLPLLGVPVHWNFQWLPPRPGIAEAVRQKWQHKDVPWIILQAGARWTNKRWPVQYYAELANRLAERYPRFHFAVLGGQEDRPIGEAIAKVMDSRRCLDLTGRISLPEMVEWIRLSTLMVTNDTGPMHVAAALGKPVVALFGPTEPRRTGPYGQLDHVLQLDLDCVPCLKPHCARRKEQECLRALPVSAVLNTMTKRLRMLSPAFE